MTETKKKTDWELAEEYLEYAHNAFALADGSGYGGPGHMAYINRSQAAAQIALVHLKRHELATRGGGD